MGVRTQTIKINLVEGNVQQSLRQTLDLISRGAAPLRIDTGGLANDIKNAFKQAAQQPLFSANQVKQELTAIATEVKNFKSSIASELNLEFHASITGLDVIENSLSQVANVAAKSFASIRQEMNSLGASAKEIGKEIVSIQQSSSQSVASQTSNVAKQVTNAVKRQLAPSKQSTFDPVEYREIAKFQAEKQFKQHEQSVQNDIISARSNAVRETKLAQKEKGLQLNEQALQAREKTIIARSLRADATLARANKVAGASKAPDFDPVEVRAIAEFKAVQQFQRRQEILDRPAQDRRNFERSRLQSIAQRRRSLVDEFQSEITPGEFFAQALGFGDAAKSSRLNRAKEIAALNPDIPNLVNRLTTVRGESGTRKDFAPPLLSGKSFSDPATLAQVALAGVSGGIGGLGVAAFGATTPLGARGALIASAVQQSVSGLIIAPLLDALREKEHEFRAAGEAYQQSILGITSVLQQSTQVIGSNGQALGSTGIGAQLQFQEKRAVEIQRAARSLLLPQGIGGASEATFVQGITSALGQRGILQNSTPEQIAKISSILAGVIRAQRPQLLENPALLNRDLQDVLSGLPQAQRTILGSLIRPALPGLAKGQNGADFLKALAPFEAFATTVSESQNIKAVQGRLEGARELNATIGGESFLEAIKPGLQSLTDTLKSPEVQESQKILGDALGRLVKVGLQLEVQFVKLTASVTNTLSPFAGLIDTLPRFAAAIIAGTVAANSGRITAGLSKLAGGLNSPFNVSLGGKRIANIATKTLGLSSWAIAAVDAATTLTEIYTDNLEKKDRADEEHVNNLIALGAKVSPTARADQNLRNVGVLENIEAFNTDQGRSTSNQILAIQSNLANLAADKREGAFNVLRDLQDKRILERSQVFGGGLAGDLQSAQLALTELTSSGRAQSKQGIVDEAVKKASESLGGKENLSPTEILSKATNDAARAKKAIEVTDNSIALFSSTISDLKTELAASGIRESGIIGGTKEARGSGQIVEELNANEAQLKLAFEEKRKHQAVFTEAQDQITRANEGGLTFGLKELNNLADAQDKILEDKNKELKAQQQITELSLQAANSFKGAFLTTTTEGAQGLASSQGKFLDEALKSSVANAALAGSQVDEIEGQLAQLAQLMDSAKTPEQLNAIIQRSDDLSAAKQAANVRKELAGADVQKNLLSVLDNELSKRNAGIGGTNIIDLQQQARGFNSFTFTGQEAITKNQIETLRGESANRTAQILSEQSRLANASPFERTAINQHIRQLQDENNAARPLLAQKEFQRDVTNPFQRAAGQLDLQRAIQDSSHLIQDEADKRRALNAELTASQNALQNFDNKIRAQTLGSENSLAALGQKIKAEGGSIPIGLDFSDERLKQATLAEDVAKFNQLAREHGILGGASGGRALGFTSIGAPIIQAQEEEKARLETASRKTSETLVGLDNEFKRLKLTLQNTIDTLSNKLGIAAPQQIAEKESNQFGPNFTKQPFVDSGLPGVKAPIIAKSQFSIEGEDLSKESFIDQAKRNQIARLFNGPTAPSSNPAVFETQNAAALPDPTAPNLRQQTGRSADTDKALDKSNTQGAQNIAELQKIAGMVGKLAGITINVKIDDESTEKIGRATGQEMKSSI